MNLRGTMWQKNESARGELARDGPAKDGPAGDEPAMDGQAQDDGTISPPKRLVPPLIIPALPDLNKLFPSGNGLRPEPSQRPISANPIPAKVASVVPGRTTLSTRQDSLERPTIPVPKWQNRVSLWVEEQAQLFGASHWGQGLDMGFMCNDLEDEP